jgi:A/G-specific adenine glycosylase
VIAPAHLRAPAADPRSVPIPRAGRPGDGEVALPPDLHGLRRAVLDWFAAHGRELAFRSAGRPDPWAVLVSEVMAQQTQVARVEERLPAFLAAFPGPVEMAAASRADVVRAWRGLGYNRRAVGLHRAAVAITAGGGRVPDDVRELRALPGVGPYTARAVAAIAFGRPVGAVDVNVRRVVGRIVAGDPAVLPPVALQAAADALVDPGRPGTWTHALMDLGAMVCRPARPACGACPAAAWCRAGAREPGEARVASPARARPPAAPARREPARARRPVPPVAFERTTRWLRGRIVDRLRDAPPDGTVAFDGPLGDHDREAVLAALVALARDGIIEHDGAGRARLARLSHAGDAP